MANAWLDRSPAVPVPAAIMDMTMKTHAFVFREYEVEYTLEESSEKHTMLTTPEHLMSLYGHPVVAQVRQGRFGWAWVETLTPGSPQAGR